MGLNGIRNPAKLRKISRWLGRPCIKAFARYFADQRTWLAFTDTDTAWVVDSRTGEFKRYTEDVHLLDDLCGFRSTPHL